MEPAQNARPMLPTILTFAFAGVVVFIAGLWLYRVNELSHERAELHAGMELLCATSVVRTLYLVDAARGMQKMLKETTPNGGVEGSFVVMTEERDAAARALLASRPPGVPVGSDPNDPARLQEVWEKVAQKDPDIARLCGAVVTATETCMPKFSFRSQVSSADKACIQQNVDGPVGALNRYLARNIHLDKKLATPRETSRSE